MAGANALVGGESAIELDVDSAAVFDRAVVMPLILLVVLLVLALLLRALVAPLLLIASVAVSYLAALGLLPPVFLTEIGVLVAFGVLVDTLVVRSILVPALVIDLDARVWWPGRLSRAEGDDRAARRAALEPAGADGGRRRDRTG